MQACKHNYFDKKGYDYKKQKAYSSNNYFGDITKILKLKKHLNFDGQPLSRIFLKQ